VPVRPAHIVRSMLVFLAALGCGADSAPPVLRIVAIDGGYEMPARIPAGITRVRLVNRGRITHEGVMVHFKAPGSAAAYADSYRAGVDFPANAEDVGGPGLATPGESSSVWMPLTPGHYAVLCFYKNHIAHGMVRDFDVVPPSSQAGPPAADIDIHLVDYAYRVNGTWTAGAHVVHVINEGTEPHEFDPYRLAPGKNPSDFFAWLENHRQGESPATPLGGSGSMVPGRQVWLPLTLTPGRYFMFCEVPSKAKGVDHYRLGMYQTFVVR
jgi:hypothetical protein